jgi:NAD(P)H-hydrate epimerase
MPGALVSLTAPKPLVKFFKGRHFLGGRYVLHSRRKWGINRDCRFVSPDIAEKYDLELPDYEGVDQVVEIGSNGQKL